MPLGNKNNMSFLTIGLAIFATVAHAQTDVAAADVNARLKTLEGQVQALMAANYELRGVNSQQQQQIAQLQASSIEGLNKFVRVDVDQHGRPAVFFDAVNLYVRDGSGSTGTLADSGLGNIILGYNEAARSSVESYCTESWSDTTHGFMFTEADCLAAGYEWTNNNKTGTHNLIIGRGNNYSGEGNIVVGAENSVADSANIVTGNYNYAGATSAILGTHNSKGFYQASILSSSVGLVTNGSMLSSSGSTVTSYFGKVIGSNGSTSNNSGPLIYIDSKPYIGN